MTREPTAKVSLPAGDPGVTVENAILACREKDGNRLRSFVAAAVPGTELEALFGRGTDVLLKDMTVQRGEDGSATATVHLKVRREGGEELVERVWELAQGSDGVWRFTGLPDCY